MISRRRLLAGGLSAAVLTALGGLYLWRNLIQSTGGEYLPYSKWLEETHSEFSNGDVVLEFVDEQNRPLNFDVFIVWEPGGEVEEASVRGGRLVLPRRKLEERVAMWVEEHRRADTPPQVETSLFVIFPISLQAQGVPYTAVAASPRYLNRRYVVRGLQRRDVKSFSRCPEGRVLYVSDANLKEYVPAVAAFDRSSRAFIECMDSSYHVYGSALRFRAYGGTSLGRGTSFRIWNSPTWSTGDLKSWGGAGRIPRGLDEDVAVMFYNTVWRYIVYEVYDIYTCTPIDTRADLYLLNIAFESGRIALRTTDRPPRVVLDNSVVSERIDYQGVDGKLGEGNMLRYVDIMMSEPLIEASSNIRLGGGWNVGSILHFLGYPLSQFLRGLYIGFSFEVFGGVANYVSTINTDADVGVKYRLEVRRAEYVHYLKDYVFRPLSVAATLVD
ncbi:MAG: hypothetical protein QXN04_07945 [Pyrobaculum sp.]